jgi:hypothetical protein
VAETIQKKSKESNGRGGKRPGAGRKAGSATVKNREIADRLMADGGVSPLEFMLAIMRRESMHEDPKIQIAQETLAFEAAKAAAPYVHPKLASVEVTGDPEKPVRMEFGWKSDKS